MFSLSIRGAYSICLSYGRIKLSSGVWIQGSPNAADPIELTLHLNQTVLFVMPQDDSRHFWRVAFCLTSVSCTIILKFCSRRSGPDMV